MKGMHVIKLHYLQLYFSYPLLTDLTIRCFSFSEPTGGWGELL
jgi:hypothetical protein